MNTPVLFGRLRRALSLLISCLVAASSITPVSAGENAAAQTPPFTAVYVIGDSLSDTGRTSAVLTQITGTAFPPAPYASGRMSNGPLWIEYFTPMLRRNYQALENFSWAGANTGSQNVFGPGLPGMLQELAEVRTPVTRTLNKNALYVVFGGANDFFRILSGGNPAEIIPAGVANILGIVTSLRSAGAENIVVVDLPDIGLIPRVAAVPGLPPVATFLTQAFNAQLNAQLNALNFPVVRVSLFHLIRDFVAHPDTYGFTNVTRPGILNYPNSDTFLFWDDVHPTTRAHRYVAEEVYAAVVAAGLVKHPLK